MKVIGLDKTSRGDKIAYKNGVCHLTGYFQYEGNTLYWQLLDTNNTSSWAKLDLVPAHVDYEGEV
jgi:hypothetical protein